MAICPRGSSLTDFRAFIGAVSLKRAEAVKRLAVGELDFRAFIGAVSLKPKGLQGSTTVQSDFRAFIGAVSLKQTVLALGEEQEHLISAPSSARSH